MPTDYQLASFRENMRYDAQRYHRLRMDLRRKPPLSWRRAQSASLVVRAWSSGIWYARRELTGRV